MRFLKTLKCLSASSLAAAAVLIAASGAVTAAAYDLEYPTESEIKARFEELEFSTKTSTEYDRDYSTSSPYDIGEVSDSSLQDALNSVNFARFVAGLPDDVQLKDTYINYAQSASLVNAMNGSLSHTPSQPSGLPDDIYSDGYTGASRSNIAMGYSNITSSVINGYLEDTDSSNLDRVGHRRWVLNPSMQYTGFGMVGRYSAMYAFDKSRSESFTGDYVCWPAKTMPYELYAYNDNGYAFSVSLGSAYDTPSLSNITVDVSSEKLGKSWHLDSSCNSTSNMTNYLNVNNAGYGMSKCIIFNVGTFPEDDKVTVKINGLTKSGVSSPLTYTVSFFNMFDESSPYNKIGFEKSQYTINVGDTVTLFPYRNPLKSMHFSWRFTTDIYDCVDYSITSDSITLTGTAAGSFSLWAVDASTGTMYPTAVTVTEKTCAHSYTSKVTTPATCTAAGVKTYTCTLCGDSYTETIPAAGHKYVSTVVAPTYAAQGYTLHKCSVCGYSYKDTYTAAKTVPTAAISQSYTSTGTSFTLNWAKVSGVTGYKIYKYNGSTGAWTLVKTISGADTLSATVTGFTPGSVIKFKVNAYVTENSVTYVGKTSDYLYAAAIANAKISQSYTSTGTSFTLNWAKVSGATGYKIYKYNGSTGKWTLVKTVSGADTLSATVTGFTPGSVIKFKVNAYLTKNGTTYYGKTSDFLSAAAIANAKISQSYTSTGTSFTLNWSKVSGATGYKIYKYNGSTGKWSLVKTVSGADTLSATVTGYTPGSVIKFKVNAYLTKNGTTHYGKTSDFLYAAALGSAKINSSYTSTATTASVSWSKVSGATGYKIYKYDDSKSAWVAVKTVTGADTLSATITGLSSGTTTKLKVNAYLTKSGTTYVGKADAVLSVKTATA